MVSHGRCQIKGGKLTHQGDECSGGSRVACACDPLLPTDSAGRFKSDAPQKINYHPISRLLRAYSKSGSDHVNYQVFPNYLDVV